jgi:putative phosphoesterase
MTLLRVGLISDTHGLLRPSALKFLQGCDHILHGGDIGKPQILETLASLAPVLAVRGNNDTADWAQDLPETAQIRLGGLTVHLIHDLAQLSIDPVATHVDIVVSGHSHKPGETRRNGVLYVNPGSCGPRRLRLPISIAELRIEDGRASAHFVQLAE